MTQQLDLKALAQRLWVGCSQSSSDGRFQHTGSGCVSLDPQQLEFQVCYIGLVKHCRVVFKHISCSRFYGAT
jgi:hypothetical protein